MKYIGIAIGPVYKTIGKAEKTRELWAASYLFSYLSRKLIEELLNAGVPTANIINPITTGLPKPKNEKPGVGLYSDRIMLQVADDDEQTFTKVHDVIKTVKQNLADEIISAIRGYRGNDPYAALFKKQLLSKNVTNANGQTVSEYLQQYFRVYAVQADAEALALEETNKNGEIAKIGWFAAINRYMDHLELRNALVHFDPDPIKVFMRAVNHSFLRDDAFQRDHFDSLYEIATMELRFIDEEARKLYDGIFQIALDKAKDEEWQNTLIESITSLEDEYKNLDKAEDDEFNNIVKNEKFKKHLRTYHRYVAIIHADVDRMGTHIGRLSNTEMRTFTEKLLEFSKDVNKKIAGQKYTVNDLNDWGYGGSPVYIGGDDLVFFAPVASRDKDGKFQTILHLIQDIDKLFQETFPESDMSISYGVNITYVKFPLKEAYKKSLDLKDEAKEYNSRNRLIFQVQKHSGQTFGAVINKNHKDIFQGFLSLLDKDDEKKKQSPEGEQAFIFVNSLTYKIDLYKAAFLVAVQNEESLTAFFDQTFNEAIHEQFRTYLNTIRDLMFALFQQAENPADEKAKEKEQQEILDTIYGLLRFIHFLNSNESPDE